MTQNLIFFDIDGTIIDSAGHIPPSAIRAIRRARENGARCIINTGRPYSHIDPAVIAIGFDGFICSCGQHIILNGASVFLKTLPQKLCAEIVQLGKACRLDCYYESEDGIRYLATHPVPPDLNRELERFSARGFSVDQSPEEPGFRFDKLCVWTHPDSDFKTFSACIGRHCSIIDRGGGMFECVVLGCSKETGVRFVIRKENIPLENCYAIGDSTNDLPMLRCVPNSIAMGGAPEQVRREAAYIAPPLEEDGLAAALEHYGFLA